MATVTALIHGQAERTPAKTALRAHGESQMFTYHELMDASIRTARSLSLTTGATERLLVLMLERGYLLMRCLLATRNIRNETLLNRVLEKEGCS